MPNEMALSTQQMREERTVFEAVYMKLIGDKKYYTTHAFCFYEGEDGKYYNWRIKQKIVDIITYSVENKNGVLNLLKLVRRTQSLDNVCMMFFVDRDYDEIELPIDEDLYITPCYSIENFYIHKECLKEILQSEFNINPTDSDCAQCISIFELREKEFNDLMLDFNSLVYLRTLKNIPNSKCPFNNIKTSQIAEVTLESAKISAKYSKTIKKIKDALEATEEEITGAKRALKERGKYSWNFRGKNQLDFFIVYIEELKKKNKAGDFFSFKHHCVDVDLRNNRLSQLSQYAITPPCLNKFIERHKKKILSQYDFSH